MKQSKKFFLYLVGTLLVIIFFNEMLFRLNVHDLVKWVFSNPLLLILNFSCLMLLVTILAALTKKLYLSIWLVTLSALSLGIANANKFSLRSVPLVLEDLFLLKEIWVLLPKLISPLTILAIILGVPLLWLSFKGFKITWGKIEWTEVKRPLNSLCLLSVLFLVFGQFAYTNDLDAWEVGFIYSLSNGTRKPAPVAIPVEDTAKKLNESTPALEDSKSSVTKPNVLVIMSEAFWDVRKLNLKFSENPMAKWDLLKEEALSGDAYVPVFGGGTANSEYEVLTGMSLKAYPYDWYMVYREAIQSPHPSLAHEFKKNDYKTLAFHPYYPWYYRRHEVYPLLGFDEFISIEAFTNELTKEESPVDDPMVEKGESFISDKVVFDKLIEHIKEENQPLFMHTVTMQNHGPYDDNRFKEGVSIESPLSDDARETLTTYTRGIQLSQEALYDLVSELKTLNEPTLVLYFGDHLPMLGSDYAYYRETDYIGEEEEPEQLKEDLRMTTVPYLIWANYPIPSKERHLGNVSTLSVELLELSGVKLSPYFSTLKTIAEKSPLFTRKYLMEASGKTQSQYAPLYQEIKGLYIQLLKETESDLIQK